MKSHSDFCRKYLLDESALSTLNDEKLFYLVGLYAADGNIYKYKNRKASAVISLSLDEKDFEFLEEVKKVFSSNYKIHLHNGAAYLTFPSNKVARDLEKYGIHPQKSKNCKLSSELINNLNVWRGLIDGDGWVGIKTDKRVYGTYHYPYIELNGSIQICTQFKEFLRSSFKYKGSVRKSQRTHRVATSGKIAYQAIQLLYPENCFSIPRKKNIAREVLQSFGEKYVQ